MLNPVSLRNLESLSDRELNRRCRRALVASARQNWHGSRAELRERVRTFLRPKRHDRSSLCSILRGVVAGSILAVSLLGLDAPAAHAVAPQFMLDPTPIGGFDVGSNSAPAFADLDGDGDLDLISGAYDGTLRYFENIGSASAALFAARTGTANPLDGFDVGYYSSPTLADLDDDGDLDLVVGQDYGAFLYFENTGSSVSPTFVARTGLDNPLDGFATADYSAPLFADLDGDGDFDLISGEGSGSLLYFENTGTAAIPAFVAVTGPTSPVDGLTTGGYSAPTLADLDFDGDLDLVVGEYAGTFAYFENAGSALSPAFVQQTGAANPLDGFDLGFNATPTFVDLNDDGDFDLVSGEYDGSFRVLSNTEPSSNADYDEATPAENPFGGLSTSGYSAPVLADLDDDGDLDAVSGEYLGAFRYYENTGNAAAAVLTERTGSANPFNGFGGGYDSSPALADLDFDGDLDLVSGSYYGDFSYFENTGSAASPTFVQRTGGANPLDGFVVGDFSTPTLADLDGDGDFDLVSGEVYGDFLYFENTGSAASPTFVQRTGGANPLDGFVVGSFSTPKLVDFDLDGDLDLVSGEDNGSFFYFENTGSAMSPVFVTRTGAANPFEGLSPGMLSTPEIADLDGDGDLDLFSGESTGTFVYYIYVPEPAGTLALAAGSGLLALLARKRRRPAA